MLGNVGLCREKKCDAFCAVTLDANDKSCRQCELGKNVRVIES